jgi:fucose permease
MTLRKDAWPGYVAIGTVGYVLYSLGVIGPYLRERLQLSDVEVGLHSTAVAIGFVVAGALGARVGARFGEVTARGAGLALMAIAVVLLASAPNIVATLVAAVAIGVGAGAVLGYTNASLSAVGGSLARQRIGRANVWAMVAAFVAPILLAAGANLGLGSSIWLIPALALLAVDAIDLRAGPRLAFDDGAGGGRLPTSFWIAWAYVVAVVAVESCVVFWAATLVERRTSSSVETASLVAALFFAGMFTGRLGLSAGLGTSGDVRLPIGVGLIVAASGATLAWVSTTPVISGVGLFAAGVGVAVLYPLGVSAALAAAPGQLAHAGARLTLASGLALLAAPLALGALADATGVVVGWSLVVILAVGALALSRALPSRPVTA